MQERKPIDEVPAVWEYGKAAQFVCEPVEKPVGDCCTCIGGSICFCCIGLPILGSTTAKSSTPFPQESALQTPNSCHAGDGILNGCNALGRLSVRLSARLLGILIGCFCCLCEEELREVRKRTMKEGATEGYQLLNNRYKLFACTSECCPTKDAIEKVEFLTGSHRDRGPLDQKMH